MNSPRRRMSEKAEETGNVEGTARPPLWSAPLIYPSRCSAKMANRHASKGQVSGPLIDVLRSFKGFHFKCLRPSQTRMVRTSNPSRNNVDKVQIDGALGKALSAHSGAVFKKRRPRQMSTRSPRVTSPRLCGQNSSTFPFGQEKQAAKRVFCPRKF